MYGEKWFQQLQIPGIGIARTKSAHRPSAYGRASHTEDRQNRWANEATRDSRDMPHRPGTTLENPHTWVDNRAPVENWKQVSVWESTFSDATPTALTWIPLLNNDYQLNVAHATFTLDF